MPKQPEITVTAVSEAVGKRIRELRRNRGLNVAELAQQAADVGHPELTRDAIYAIESGRRLEGRRRRTVSVDELLAFAEVLGVPVATLLWPSLGGRLSLLFDSPADLEGFARNLVKALELTGRMPPDQEGAT